MTTVRVNNYTLRRLTNKGKARYQARWFAAFRGELRFFKTRKKAVDTIRKWPPRGLNHIKA